MRTDYAITEATAGELAAASMRYRVTSPSIYVAVLVELVTAGLLAGAGQPWWAAGLAVLALGLPVVLLLQAPSLAQALRRGGYRPGTTMTVDWDDDTFTVTTPDATGTHRYEHVSSARAVGAGVVLRLRGTRALLVLPAGAVPATVGPRLSPKSRIGAP